jgi:hypothetical protein
MEPTGIEPVTSRLQSADLAAPQVRCVSERGLAVYGAERGDQLGLDGQRVGTRRKDPPRDAKSRTGELPAQAAARMSRATSLAVSEQLT